MLNYLSRVEILMFTICDTDCIHNLLFSLRMQQFDVTLTYEYFEFFFVSAYLHISFMFVTYRTIVWYYFSWFYVPFFVFTVLLVM